MKKMFYICFAMFIASTAFAQNIEFNVDMSVKAQEGVFVPGTDAVHLAGNFTNWGTGWVEMTDGNNDSIYTATVAIDTVTFDTFEVGDTLLFKFVRGDNSWESDPNRMLVVPENDTAVTYYFDRDSIVSLSIDLTFSCNMEFEIVSGRFNPSTDTLTVRGSFNGWSGDDMMTPSIQDPNFYETTISYPTSAGEVINYKYAYINATGVAWEGDPNKTYTVTADDISAGFAFVERTYNDLTLDDVTNNPVTIKFVVNVDGAVSSVTGQPFAAIENVVIAGANPPLQWPGGGWPDSDSNAVKNKFLFNDGTNGDDVAGDSLWTIELVFSQYSPLRIQYKYGANWGLPSNTGSNDNESSVGTDHFINLTPELLSATVRNQWSVMGDHELVDVVLGVEEIPAALPVVYSLKQNYPNPFNPTTNIQFAIPQAGLVTMKIYNILGQEVATLLNEHKNAGTYTVDFDASGLNSGVYFYKIESGAFTSTKKMILMK